MALGEYSPLGTLTAALILPLAITFYPPNLETIMISEQAHGLLWTAFMTSFAAQKINDYSLYRHIGVQRVAHFQSNRIWFTPCMGALKLDGDVY